MYPVIIAVRFYPDYYNKMRNYDYKLPHSITFATIPINKLTFRNYEPIYDPAFIITMHFKL
jgi:hypothetical protein